MVGFLIVSSLGCFLVDLGKRTLRPSYSQCSQHCSSPNCSSKILIDILLNIPYNLCLILKIIETRSLLYASVKYSNSPGNLSLWHTIGPKVH